MSLGGGSQQSSSSSNQQSGFRDLPPEIQNVFKQLATTAQQYIGPAGTQAYTPLPQTAGETSALNTLNAGTAPTAQSISSDISMQQNPYNKYVINEINRQAGGQNSILQQNLNSAGQFGSNRQFLGANDIDLSRQNQIGSFLQGNYDSALNNALTTLPNARIQGAQNQLNAGSFSRGLAGQTAQAPITSLQQIAQVLGILPTNSSQGTSTANSSGWNANFGTGNKLFG